MDTSIITLIASISGIIVSFFVLVIVRIITGFANKNLIESFNVSKGFVRKVEMSEFKNEIKTDLAIERVALQELLMQQLDKSIDNKIKEFRNIGNKLLSIDETINELELLREEFKDKVSSFNLIDDKVTTLRKEVNSIKYGTESPNEEVIERRKG